MTQAAPPGIDQARSKAFGEKMLEVLNHAALALMTSIGHRTRLFDTMAEMSPATSQEIAARAGLNERYVREWLGSMVTGGIVEYDPQSSSYALPTEHAAWLTRAAGPDNVAATTQWIPVMAGVENPVVDCFARGGGVPYERFNRFHEVMAQESAETVATALTEQILPLVPGLAGLLEKGIDVLDVGCGAGGAMNHLAQTFPASHFRGYDLCEEAIAMAWSEAKQVGLENVCFETRDVAAISETAAYDVITAFDTIHDQKDPAAVLLGIHEALRPGGTFLMQDIAASSHLHRNLEHPLGPFLYTISTMHCMSVSLAQGGAGLGTVWGEELAVEMLGEAGFGGVEVKRLPHDILNNYYLAKKA